MPDAKLTGDGESPGTPSRQWLRPELHDLPRYGAGTSAPAGHTGPWRKLSSNESPFAPSDAVVSAIEQAARAANRYPAVFGGDLAAALARRHGLPPERVAVAGGSLVLLQQAVQAVASPGDEVIFGWRSYEAYPIIVQTARCQSVAVPLREHKLDLEALERRIGEATRVVIACSPNNPTGTDVSSEDLEGFLESSRGRCLVILDEAYREFSTAENAPNGLELQERFDHLLVLRTFSKAHNLAGARVGWCAGNPEIVAALTRVALPFTLSRLASAAAAASLGDGSAGATARIAQITSERQRVTAALTGLGFQVPDSQANFFWLPLDERSDGFSAACAARGVSVRCFSKEGVRITIGTPADNDIVLEAARDFADQALR